MFLCNFCHHNSEQARITSASAFACGEAVKGEELSDFRRFIPREPRQTRPWRYPTPDYETSSPSTPKGEGFTPSWKVQRDHVGISLK